MDVVIADTEHLLDEHHRIRREVFIDEQGVTEDEEWDGRDELPGTLRVLGLQDGEVVAAGRLLDLDSRDLNSPNPDTGDPDSIVAHLGRVAVAASHRGTGLGRELMVGLERLAAEHTTGPLRLVLDAQEYASGFYASLGYQPTARERFLDARIWHVEMAKQVR